jgi:hypothetical protein
MIKKKFDVEPCRYICLKTINMDSVQLYDYTDIPEWR